MSKRDAEVWKKRFPIRISPNKRDRSQYILRRLHPRKTRIHHPHFLSKRQRSYLLRNRRRLRILPLMCLVARRRYHRHGRNELCVGALSHPHHVPRHGKETIPISQSSFQLPLKGHRSDARHRKLSIWRRADSRHQHSSLHGSRRSQQRYLGPRKVEHYLVPGTGRQKVHSLHCLSSVQRPHPAIAHRKRVQPQIHTPQTTRHLSSLTTKTVLSGYPEIHPTPPTSGSRNFTHAGLQWDFERQKRLLPDAKAEGSDKNFDYEHSKEKHHQD